MLATLLSVSQRSGSPARYGRRSQVKALIAFTLLGVADLVSALTLGALTGFLQIVHVNPAATLNAELPLAMIPTVGVPLLLAMHLTSLRVLFRIARPNGLPTSWSSLRDRVTVRSNDAIQSQNNTVLDSRERA